MCFGGGAVLLLLHAAAWAGAAVVRPDELRVGLGIAGLVLLTVAHVLRMGLLAEPRPLAAPTAPAGNGGE